MNKYIKLVSIAMAAALLVVFSFSSCSDGKTDDGTGKRITFPISDDPKNLDPQMASDNVSLLIIKNIFEGLVRLDEYGGAIPGVAKEWYPNEDNTVFTFKLREDAMWANGDRVTASDFVYSFRRCVDPSTYSSTCSAMFSIKNAYAVNQEGMAPEMLGVTAVDETTLVIELEYAFPEFPVTTAGAPFMPCHRTFFESTKGHYGMDDNMILGNGPFTLTEDSWVEDEQVKLLKNEYYSGANEVSPSSVVLSIKKSSVDYMEMVIGNNADAVAFDNSEMDKVTDNELSYITYTDTTWGFVFSQKSTAMSNKNIRLAFIRAIDQESYLEHLPDSMEAAFDIVPPATRLNGTLYREIAGNGYKLEQNSSAAQSLMKNGLGEIGYTSMPKVTVTCPDDDQVKVMMQYLIQSWQENLRVYVNVEYVSVSSLKSKVKSGDYQIALYPLTPTSDGPLSCLNIFRSTTSGNPARYDNKAYDELLNSASVSMSADTKLVSLIAAEKMLNEEGIFYPMYYESHYYALRRGTSGIIISPFSGIADFTTAKRITE